MLCKLSLSVLWLFHIVSLRIVCFVSITHLLLDSLVFLISSFLSALCILDISLHSDMELVKFFSYKEGFCFSKLYRGFLICEIPFTNSQS